jgi:hypothetical protein
MKRLAPCPTCQRHVFVDEAACPHCRTSGSSFTRALALVAAVGMTACNRGQEVVYGPPPVQPDARVEPAPSTTDTSSIPAPVYGPPPVQPDTRTQPSASASAPALAVYGPPPVKPDARDGGGRHPIPPIPLPKP